MWNSKLIILITLISLSCQPQKEDKIKGSSQSSPNEKEILNRINKVYNNILVEADKKPNYELIIAQFTPNAQMGFVKNDSLILQTPTQYFASMKEMLANSEVNYLKEWEIEGETKAFGSVAQRTSLYGVHFNTKDSIAEKGIINFQLVKTKGEWKILSMIWQAEKEGLKVSESYFQ
jgi:hypothetical protein